MQRQRQYPAELTLAPSPVPVAIPFPGIDLEAVRRSVRAITDTARNAIARTHPGESLRFLRQTRQPIGE